MLISATKGFRKIIGVGMNRSIMYVYMCHTHISSMCLDVHIKVYAHVIMIVYVIYIYVYRYALPSVCHAPCSRVAETESAAMLGTMSGTAVSSRHARIALSLASSPSLRLSLLCLFPSCVPRSPPRGTMTC